MQRFLVNKTSQKLQRFLCLFFGCCLAFLPTAGNSLNSRSLTILSEPSTSLALTKIVRSFARTHNVIVAIDFDSSFDLIKKIDDGLPSDVFISANLDAIDGLRHKGLIDIYNIVYIASDKIVLVTSKHNQKTPPHLLLRGIDIETALKAIDEQQNFLAIDYRGYSSGIYADKIVSKIDLKKLQLVHKLPEDKHSLVSDLVKDKNLFAITLASQVANKSDFLILGTENNRIPSYQAIAIAGNNMEVAREFLNFLKSDFAHQIMQENGYLVN